MIHLVGFTDSILHFQVLLLIKKLHLVFVSFTLVEVLLMESINRNRWHADLPTQVPIPTQIDST